MMKQSSSHFLLGALATALAAAAASAASAAPAADLDRVANDIRILASDDFEGRAPATRGETKTTDYGARQMKDAGLTPAGDKGGWFQKVPLRQSDIIGQPSLSMTFGGKTQALVQSQEVAIRAAQTGQAAVRISNLPLVFVGYGVKAPERNWDDFKGVDLKGKIMVVLVNDPDFEGGEGDFGGKQMTYYGRWTYKYEEAARQGAAGVLVIHETDPASYGWATVKNSNTNPMFDIVRADPTKTHVPMEGWIQRDLAVSLFKASGLDFETARVAARKADFKPVPLAATMSADYRVKSSIITSNNVAGLLKGSKYPDETVIYSAHWDHLGVGAPDSRGDTIYNGAKDNASGTAALLELARMFQAGARPERSILFLAVTAEERGLLGSEYYATNPLRPLATTAGVINMDGPVGMEKTKDFSIYGLAKLDLLDMLTEEAARLGRHYTPDVRAEAGTFYRSDHFSMAKLGVPAITFSPGQDLVDGGAARGKELSAAYTRDRYHQPSDGFDDSWNRDSWSGDLTLLHAIGNRLANTHAWPNWSQDSEFRAARDASAAQRK